MSALGVTRWALLAVAAILAVQWVAGGTGSRWLTAVKVLDELRRPGPRSWLQRSTEPARLSQIRLEGPKAFDADVYHPAQGNSPVPMMLVPGAVELGKDDPRVQPFAELLARAGFTVVVPDLPSLRTLQVDPAHVGELAAAHRSLCARRDLAPHGRAGILGVSYAGGIAFLVALDRRHAERVPYVATVGTFADLDTAVRFLATGELFERGRKREVRVDPYGRLVFVRTYQAFMTDPADRTGLDSIIRRRWTDPAADIRDLAGALGPQGRLVVELFEGGDESRVPGLMARLPDGLRRRMASLSPGRRDFSSLRARLYLVHAVDDGIFPVTESERLARRAAGRVPVRFVRLGALQHVELRPRRRGVWSFLSRDLPEAARLASWWAALLTERDR